MKEDSSICFFLELLDPIFSISLYVFGDILLGLAMALNRYGSV